MKIDKVLILDHNIELTVKGSDEGRREGEAPHAEITAIFEGTAVLSAHIELYQGKLRLIITDVPAQEGGDPAIIEYTPEEIREELDALENAIE